MNPTKKQIEKWCAALRSGNYNQTQETMQNNEGYCCLGVACHVFIPKNKIKKDSHNFIMGDVPKKQDKAPLWLKKINNNFCESSGFLLSELNDGFRIDGSFNFDEIADVLELVYIHKALK